MAEISRLEEYTVRYGIAIPPGVYRAVVDQAVWQLSPRAIDHEKLNALLGQSGHSRRAHRCCKRVYAELAKGAERISRRAADVALNLQYIIRNSDELLLGLV
jgi:hypothetical protein